MKKRPTIDGGFQFRDRTQVEFQRILECARAASVFWKLLLNQLGKRRIAFVNVVS
ncbi:MAG: hypothetical protein AAFX56_04225 [Pseudomonadota bacterium]